VLVVDLAPAGSVHSDTLAAGEVIQDDVPIYSRYDQMGETTPTPTILGISRIDPFRALPVPPDQDTYQLLDHCKFLSTQISSGTYSWSISTVRATVERDSKIMIVSVTLPTPWDLHAVPGLEFLFAVGTLSPSHDARSATAMRRRSRSLPGMISSI
jgi:hypothetical protein